jgi:prepilin-type processing-associated H-X9-DG protein
MPSLPPKSPSTAPIARLSRRRPDYAGLSVIELLVVAALVAILAVMALPFLRQAQGSALSGKSLANLRSSTLLLLTAVQDRGGTFPWSGKGERTSDNWLLEIEKSIPGTIADPSTGRLYDFRTRPSLVFLCPTAMACHPRLAPDTRSTWAMNSELSGLPLLSLPEPSKTVLLINGPWNSSHRKWLLLEYLVESMPEPEFPYPVRPLGAEQAPGEADVFTHVAFVDGHVERVSSADADYFPAEADRVPSWKPF